MSPSCRRVYPSYIAHAPSISTCDSEIGGHAPMASMVCTNANVCPAR